MSSTPTTASSIRIGITIYDFDNELQAICPSNLFTSYKIIEHLFFQAVPHTPTPLNNFVQAGGP